MKLEQIYYGSNEKSLGYTCLSYSPGGKDFVSFVEKLCASIGTPDGFTKTEDFFISAFYKDFCVMIKGFAGNKDFAGRSGALIFHTLIGRKINCQKYNVSVASLDRTGNFKNQISETIENIEINSPLPKVESNSLPLNILTAINKNELIAIKTDEPLNNFGEAICFSEKLAYTKSFATMCYNSDCELDLICLSKEVSASNNRKLFQQSGRLIVGKQVKSNNSEPFEFRKKVINKPKIKNKFIRLVLIISIILNVIWGFYFVTFSKAKPKFDGKIILKPTEEINRIEALKIQKTTGNKDVINFLDSVTEYINFVNKNFVDKNKLKNIKEEN